MADTTPTAVQEAGQVAGSSQTATADAASTQIKPTNTNISVRVLSPGDDGDVTQTNTSTADAAAANVNKTDQTALQGQGGTGGTQVQEVGQVAGSVQDAEATADSTQIKPTNTNVSVRVLSPGDTGDVTQSNTSSATAEAVNYNDLDQKVVQEQAGKPKPTVLEESPCQHSCAPHDDGVGIQAAGQEAWNKQIADADATSKQIGAVNANVPVDVDSGHCGCDGHDRKIIGHGGDVSQSNTSDADASAGNVNATDQTVKQVQFGSGPIAVQAAGQLALNWQKAEADADSFQLHPSDVNLDGSGGDVDQSNSSDADATAANYNDLDQFVLQAMGFTFPW